MIIRKFSLSDLEQVLEIEKASFSNSHPKFYFQELYQNHPETFLVAENEGKILGYITSREKKGIAEIITIAVNPNFRRKKIGQNLVNSLINLFKEKGLKEVFLHVRISNDIGISFHQSMGFKILEKIENYYPNGESAYLMKKEILSG